MTTRTPKGSERYSLRRLRRAARLARRLMPTNGDLEGWLQNLSEHRGRPIKLSRQDLAETHGLSGICIARDEADYIILDAAASPSRQVLVLSHEVAHLLLGHHGNPASSEVAAWITPDLSRGLVGRVLTRHGYSSVEERAAEELATLLTVEHARRQRATELRANSVSARLR